MRFSSYNFLQQSATFPVVCNISVHFATWFLVCCVRPLPYPIINQTHTNHSHLLRLLLLKTCLVRVEILFHLFVPILHLPMSSCPVSVKGFIHPAFIHALHEYHPEISAPALLPAQWIIIEQSQPRTTTFLILQDYHPSLPLLLYTTPCEAVPAVSRTETFLISSIFLPYPFRGG